MTWREPWWCPFLWKLNDRGKVVWKAYTFDPMGGSGGRMGGLVSDSAIRTMAAGGAWFKASSRRGMFLKVLTADMEELFGANVPDAVPYALARRGERCVIVGMARSGASPIEVPLVGKHAGGLDAYLMVVELPR